MKSKLLILGIAFFLFARVNLFAQASTVDLKPVTTGQIVPDYLLKGLINYSSQEAKLTDFEGKLLILDFWNLHCLSCIESWPKLIKLQEQFKDNIKIILVNTDENESEVSAYLQKREKVLGLTMPLTRISGDKNMKVLFPHQTVPHMIWIGEKGVVKNISSGYDVNVETITKYLQNRDFKVVEKTDDRVIVNWSKPLFINGNGGSQDSVGQILASSVMVNTPLSQYITWVEFGSTEGRSFGVLAKLSVKDMITVLYGQEPILAKTELDTKSREILPNSLLDFRDIDTTKLVSMINGSFHRGNLYALQTILQKEQSVEETKKNMIMTLENSFGLKTNWEKQKKKCLVLSRSKYPLRTYKDGEARGVVTEMNLDVNNITTEKFLFGLANSCVQYRPQNSPYPVLDESNFKGKIGQIKIEANICDYKTLNEQLEKHGFRFSLENREVDVLVITSNHRTK